MQGDPSVLELLNDVLTSELTAVNQYFLHAKLCHHWGYERLAEKIRHESIDEMRHVEQLTDRILYLEGVPNYQRLFSVRVGETVAEQFELDLQTERESIKRLNDGIADLRGRGRQRQPGAAGPHPGRRGGARRLAGDAARGDPARSGSRTTSPSSCTELMRRLCGADSARSLCV